MNQSKFLAITCNSLKAREKSCIHSAIGFGFASHWLKNWRESFKPITKRSNRNHVITFDSHLKTALIIIIVIKCYSYNFKLFLCSAFEPLQVWILNLGDTSHSEYRCNSLSAQATSSLFYEVIDSYRCFSLKSSYFIFIFEKLV